VRLRGECLPKCTHGPGFHPQNHTIKKKKKKYIYIYIYIYIYRECLLYAASRATSEVRTLLSQTSILVHKNHKKGKKLEVRAGWTLLKR
jgi:hypothetical protein